MHTFATKKFQDFTFIEKDQISNLESYKVDLFMFLQN